MTNNERIILTFCIGEWKKITCLRNEIPHSTLYKVAKNLCGKKLLVRRRDRGHKTTQTGIQALQQDESQIEIAPIDTTIGKVESKEPKKVLKKPPVNLAAIQKLLGLSDKTVNSFLSFYPPLKKVPTPTHEAMIELIFAQISNRAQPVTSDHQLSFLYFGDIFKWKTNSAKFCIYMIYGEIKARYLIDMDKERGFSLWVRKDATGRIKFKREILEMPYICLEEYQKASKEAKDSASHLLNGRTEISVENETQVIRCVTQVNLNPEKGKDIFQKTGFNTQDIRRFIPCNLDVIKLPNLKRVGEIPLDLAKNHKIIQIRKPTSDCKQYREELCKYFEKIFTEDGQRYIDIDGLLNVARGFTAYGFSPSEAVRYVLYKASLPYHTLGWVEEEWIQGFGEKKSIAKIEKILTPGIEIGKQSAQIRAKKDLETLRNTIKFKQDYKDEQNKLKEFATQIEQVKNFINNENFSWEKIDELLLERGYGAPSPEKCENALEEVSKEYKGIQEGDWSSLKKFKEANKWLNETYIKLLIEAKQRIEVYEEKWNQIQKQISDAKRIDEISPIRKIIAESDLPDSQMRRLQEATNEKKTSLEQQNQAKRNSLVKYLNNPELDNLNKNITPDLIQLDLIEKKTINGEEKLQDVQGNIYDKDKFNFTKFQSNYFGRFEIDEAKAVALTLLTGKKHKSAFQVLTKYSQAQQQAEQRKANWESLKRGLSKTAPWVIGGGGIAAVVIKYFSSKKKGTQTTSKEQARKAIGEGYIYTRLGQTKVKIWAKQGRNYYVSWWDENKEYKRWVNDIEGISFFQLTKPNSPESKTLFNQINPLKPCPNCGSQLEQDENPLYWYCPNCHKKYLL